MTTAWIAELDRAAAASLALTQVAEGGDLVIQQVVTDGPEGPVAYRIELRAGRPAVVAGEGPATVTLRTDHATAAAIHAGEESAQAAFMAGRLRLGGDIRALLAHREALAALDDVFATVRAGTTV